MRKHFFSSLPFGRSLAIVAKNYFGALTKRLEHLEIERYYSILIVVESVSSGCTQQFICDQLKIDKVSMVRMLDYLLKKEFIKKIVNPEDRREYLIELTEKAHDTLPEIHACIQEVNRAAMKGIPIPVQEEFHRSLFQIQQNLEQLPSRKIFINYKKAGKKS